MKEKSRAMRALKKEREKFKKTVEKEKRKKWLKRKLHSLPLARTRNAAGFYVYVGTRLVL